MANWALAKRYMYGNNAIDITTEAPNKFFIDGRYIPISLKEVARGLAYSNAPTNINA